MSDWNAQHYLKYGDERTRPAVDLAARIKLEAPTTLVDLGCGPGNSTQVLHARWPRAGITGVDNSAQMIAAAQHAYPHQTWVHADAAVWRPNQAVSLVYSNAAFQWLPDHSTLLQHLFNQVASGGALAFQVPSAQFATVRTLIHDISRVEKWSQRMETARQSLTLQTPEFYYDVLAPLATSLDIWETEYQHAMDSPSSIVDWMASTGLRPFLAALDTEAERQSFVEELQSRVASAYTSRIDGKVLFPFRRTFVIAYR